MANPLLAPCKNCPFLRKNKGLLHIERRREIAASIRRGQWFACHATVDYSGENDGKVTAASQSCAGSVCTTENERDAVDESVYKGHQNVFRSLDDWIRGRRRLKPKQEKEVETCSVVDEDCVAPAGYRTGSGVSVGTTPAGHHCDICGEAVCEACSKIKKKRRICNACLEAERD